MNYAIIRLADGRTWGIQRSDGASVPRDTGNRDWQDFVAWNAQQPSPLDLSDRPPDPPTQEQVNETSLRTKVRNAIGNLETADASWGSLTAAQKDAALRLSVRVTAKLARLAVVRLEAD